jgi:hypothetical protein
VDVRLRAPAILWRFATPSSTIREQARKKVADYQSEGARRRRTSRARPRRRLVKSLPGRGPPAAHQGQAETEATASQRSTRQGRRVLPSSRNWRSISEILGDNKTMLLLSSHGELFDVLFKRHAPAATGRR